MEPLLWASTGLLGFVALQAWRWWRLAERENRALVVQRGPALRSAEARRENEARERALLLRVLTPQQAACYQKEGAFEVCTRAGHRYRLTGRSLHGVIELDKAGQPCASFCIAPVRGVSEAARLTALTLLLSTDEVAFRRIANRSPFRPLPARDAHAPR